MIKLPCQLIDLSHPIPIWVFNKVIDWMYICASLEEGLSIGPMVQWSIRGIRGILGCIWNSIIAS